jgi:hypothetical protein
MIATAPAMDTRWKIDMGMILLSELNLDVEQQHSGEL